MSEDLAALAERLRIIEHFRHDTDFDDLPAEAWERIDQGLTLGFFQIEKGEAAKKLAQQIRPRNIEDAAVMVALNRPGPLRSGDTARYVKRRQGLEDVTYPHPILEEILEPTNGVFVFQEQVIAYFAKIGYSPSEADNIRKIVGKKLPEEMLAELPRYLERAEKHMNKASAERIWQLIVNYSKYGFNKAHAVAYATILAWCVYAKHRWPTEFIMGSIETVDKKKVGDYISEARRMKIAVRGPHLNESSAMISKHPEGGIIYGMMDVKGIGQAAADAVVVGQPYESPEDFVTKTTANAGIKKLLSRAGALDHFGYRLEVCLNCEGKGRVPEMVPKKNNDGLKRVLVDCPDCTGGFAKSEIPSDSEKADLEEELLGVILTDLYIDIRAKHADLLAGLSTPAAANNDELEEPISVKGIISKLRQTKVGPGKRNAGAPMAHFDLEWEAESIRVVAFPDKWTSFKFMLKDRTMGEFLLKPGEKSAQLIKAWQLTAD